MPPSEFQPLLLWRTLCRIPSLHAPHRLWRLELADQWELCHQFLTATPKLAAWTLASNGVTPCDVIEHDDGSLVGIDRLQGETFDVVRSDVVVYRFQIRELSHFLMEILGGEIEFETESIGSPHHRLGRLSRRFKSTRVHLCTRNDRTSLLSVADTLRPTKPLLLFVPTLAGTDADIDSLDEHHRVVVLGLDKLVVKSGDSIVVNRDAMEDMRCRLSLGDDLDTNFFRRNGSGYDICFQGKRFPLTDAVGLWYLAEFLAKPGDTLDPVELEAARTGINARSSTSGTGETIDDEALADYKRQLLELSEDIAIAERNRDVGTLERLQPKILNWTPVGHTGAAEIVWEVEFHTSPCSNNSSGLAAFNYEIKFGINARGYSSRSVTGYLQVAMTRDGRNIPDTADAYRELVVIQSPVNFKRDSQDYSLSADKTRLNFSVTDKEIESPNAFPQGVVEITARHRARWTKRGRSRFRLPNTISANIVLSADQPRIRAWEIFRLLVSARTAYAIQASSTSSPVIIESLDVEEDLFGASLSFSVDYSVLASLEDFLGKTGLLTPLGNNWTAWKSSIETAESQRGFAQLKHTKEEDRITDLCDTDPATGQPSNIPFIGPNTSHTTFCNPKPDAEKSWLEFEASIIDETDSSVIVSGTITSWTT